MEMATELELQVQPEDVAALLASHDQTFFLANEHSRLLLKMESTCDKDLVSGVLDHYIGLLDTVVAGFLRGLTSVLKSSTVGTMLSNGTAYYREIVPEREGQSKRHRCLILRKCYRQPNLQLQVAIPFNSK